MIYTFKGPTLPSVAPPDCAAINDFWIDSSTNPAVVKLITGTAGGVVTTTSVGAISTTTLLSDNHSDTVAATPIEGAMIVGADDGSGNAKWSMLAPGPSGSFLGSDGASIGYFQPAAALQRGTTVTFHQRAGTATTSWTNMPLAQAELFGPTAPTGTNRVVFPITGYTKVAIYAKVSTAGASGSKIWIEASSDGTTFLPIDGQGGTGSQLDIYNGGVVAPGGLLGPTATVAANLTGLVYLKIMGNGGDGVIDPSFGSIVAVFW